MSDHPGAADPPGPLDEDAAFAAIIAGFDAPAFDPTPPTPPVAPPPVDPPRFDPPPVDPPRGPRDYEPAAESEHYLPPPPAPRPPTHPTTKWGLATIGLGLVLLIAPWLLSLEQTDGIDFLGVGAILAGIGLLVSRLRTGNDPGGYDDDDGAVV